MRSRSVAAVACLITVMLVAVNAPGAGDAYRLALPGYRFEFPRDHFNHPEFQTEWWYYTGNLHTAQGRRFGFELTFFRRGVDREADPTNVWDVRDLWMAHLAVSDIQGSQFLHTERLNRSGPGLAGADFKLARVWNGNWQAQWTLDSTVPAGGTQTLQAIADKFSLELSLKPEKPPAINGVNGVSQKAEGTGKASHYISLTRLETTGTIVLDGKRFAVEGASWMDHEFFSHQLDSGQSGWDWFSLQLDDRSELMLYRLRRSDGTPDPYSAGTYVDSQGHTLHLSAGDFTVTAGKTWTSDTTGGRYPVEWAIEVPSLGFKATIHTPLHQQEIAGSGTNYWEGAIDIDATRLNRPLRGAGYLEMTGYAGKIVGLD
jgi:predicted secreted hydrolase